MGAFAGFSRRRNPSHKRASTIAVQCRTHVVFNESSAFLCIIHELPFTANSSLTAAYFLQDYSRSFTGFLP